MQRDFDEYVDMIAGQHPVDYRHAHLGPDLPDDLPNPQAHIPMEHLEAFSWLIVTTTMRAVFVSGPRSRGLRDTLLDRAEGSVTGRHTPFHPNHIAECHERLLIATEK